MYWYMVPILHSQVHVHVRVHVHTYAYLRLINYTECLGIYMYVCVRALIKCSVGDTVIQRAVEFHNIPPLRASHFTLVHVQLCVNELP